tara:strand:- start:113 stop:1030 length:918 start_codon:yes stop_codon:yes gene_type:complete
MNYKPSESYSLNEIPFIPVRIFKDYDMKSIKNDEIFKIMRSSGTSGQSFSKIYLNRNNAILQTKVLTKLVSTVLGNKRLPMLIVDSPSTVKNRKSFSARAAGIIGFSTFGKRPVYALNDKMELDIENVSSFFKRYKNENVFIFGFTFIVWKFFIQSLIDKKLKFNNINGTLIHGGGWKKLIEESVNNNEYKSKISNILGINKVVNYYGMVEQTGSIFLECDQGNLKTSIYSDIIIRRNDFSACGFNEPGIIQIISLLPLSYPGHSLISEDIGELVDCKCDNPGKCFVVHGRIAKAEIRGCSDTVE